LIFNYLILGLVLYTFCLANRWLSGVLGGGYILPQWGCEVRYCIRVGASLQQGSTQLPAHSSGAEHVQTYIHQPSHSKVTRSDRQSSR